MVQKKENQNEDPPLYARAYVIFKVCENVKQW